MKVEWLSTRRILAAPSMLYRRRICFRSSGPIKALSGAIRQRAAQVLRSSEYGSYAYNNGFNWIRALALAEYQVVHGVANALKSISQAAAQISESDPSQMLDQLTRFGAILTKL